MDRKVFIEKVIAHIRKVLKSDDATNARFVVTMHFGERIQGSIILGTEYVLVKLAGKYEGWRLSLTKSGVNDGVGPTAWSNFDIDAIYKEMAAEQTLEGSVEILLTQMMEW